MVGYCNSNTHCVHMPVLVYDVKLIGDGEWCGVSRTWDTNANNCRSTVYMHTMNVLQIDCGANVLLTGTKQGSDAKLFHAMRNESVWYYIISNINKSPDQTLTDILI